MSATPAQLRAVADALEAKDSAVMKTTHLIRSLPEPQSWAAMLAYGDNCPYLCSCVALALRLEAALIAQRTCYACEHHHLRPCHGCEVQLAAIVRAALGEGT